MSFLENRRSQRSRKWKSKRLNIPVKPLNLKPLCNRKAKLKRFTHTHTFFIFSPCFLPIFSESSKCQKVKLFPSPANKCLQNNAKVKNVFCSNEFFPCKGFCVNRSCTCCGNVLETSYMASGVCQDEILSHIMSSCALSLDTRISKHKLTKCHNKTGASERRTTFQRCLLVFFVPFSILQRQGF